MIGIDIGAATAKVSPGASGELSCPGCPSDGVTSIYGTFMNAKASDSEAKALHGTRSRGGNGVGVDGPATVTVGFGKRESSGGPNLPASGSGECSCDGDMSGVVKPKVDCGDPSVAAGGVCGCCRFGGVVGGSKWTSELECRC